MAGVPVGMQLARLLWHSNPCPIDLTRTVNVPGFHMAVTHGPFATGGGGKAQPATTDGTLPSGTGVPMTLTRGLGAMNFTCPACEHRATAFMFTRKPGIRSPPARRC